MTVHVAAITFDSSNALLVAGFWSGAVGRPVDHEGEMAASEFFARIPGGDGDPMMMFIQGPRARRRRTECTST